MAEPDSSLKGRLPAIMGGAIGNLVEWYDWYVFSAFSLYFAPAFFPDSDLTAQLLNSAGIFAAGFLMRPLGGWFFGRLADRKGRKHAMTASVLLMSFGSLMIALTPSYNSIGVAAPVLLLAARLLQGLSVGGEYGTSATYLSEVATARRRGFFSSFQYVTLIGGQLLALALQLVLQRVLLTEQELESWGWRIPFAIGAVLAVVALYLRKKLHETEAFGQNRDKTSERGSVRVLLRHPAAILTVVGLTLGGTVAFYTYSTYMQKYLVNTVHLSKDDSTIISFVTLLVFALVQPLFGLLSDHVGRKPLLIGFGVLGTIFTVPIMTGIREASSHTEIAILIMAALLIVTGYTSINAVVKAELFPSGVRAIGVGLPYALTVAVFGGSAEYVALYLKSVNLEDSYYYFVSGCIFISLLVYLFMNDTRTHSKIETE